ncbi:Uncharacterised protein [Mycobacterium tuberculosis]|nr:Uncharacterised protein [Mycobacterium tuberculosis]
MSISKWVKSPYGRLQSIMKVRQFARCSRRMCSSVTSKASRWPKGGWKA